MITNDGATILKEMNVSHPAGRMLVELSESQDVEAGDGTTSVVVIAGALLQAASTILDQGVHPQIVGKGFMKALAMALETLKEITTPVSLEDEKSLETSVATALQSKILTSLSSQLTPMAVQCVTSVWEGKGQENPSRFNDVDLRKVRVVKQLGGTVEDSEMMLDGLALSGVRVARVAGGPGRMENAKIGLIQFCLSLPKTNLDQQITIRDYSAMDRLLRQERLQMSKMVRAIAKTGCNVLLVQKSILRDAVSDLALDFLAKAKILVIKDVERDDIECLVNALGCAPIASLDHFEVERLGSAKEVCEDVRGDSRVVKFLGVANPAASSSIILRASNMLTLEEAQRSFRDAICVVRSLIRSPAMLPGGGAAEIHISTHLQEKALALGGLDQICVRAFAEALKVIPYTLAENAGLNPIEIVTQLRNKHLAGHHHAGVNVKKGCCADDMITQLQIVQPLLVTQSALKLATETAVMILKIDDCILCR